MSTIGPRDVLQYYLEGQKHGKTFSELRDGLKLVSVKQGAYGDWYEYCDENGNHWEEYKSIGD